MGLDETVVRSEGWRERERDGKWGQSWRGGKWKKEEDG